jgi:hypothetical protein
VTKEEEPNKGIELRHGRCGSKYKDLKSKSLERVESQEMLTRAQRHKTCSANRIWEIELNSQLLYVDPSLNSSIDFIPAHYLIKAGIGIE